MERKFIFLSKVFHDELGEAPNDIVAKSSLQQLQLKKAGDVNHSYVTHIQELRLKQGLTVADITRLTGLSYDNYMKYEKGLVKPNYTCLDTLEKLSNVFGEDLTTDYHKFKKDSQRIVNEYKTKHNLSISQFANMMGVSKATVKNWLYGVCAPSYDKWEQYFK